MKWLLLAAAAIGGYFLFSKAQAATAAPAANALPASAQFIQSISFLGVTGNLYATPNGYYVQAQLPTGMLETLGPYSQQQVYAALAIKNAL